MAPVTKPHEIRERSIKWIFVDVMTMESFRSSAATAFVWHARFPKNLIRSSPRIQLLPILLIIFISRLKFCFQAIPVLFSPFESRCLTFTSVIFAKSLASLFGVLNPITSVRFVDLLYVAICVILLAAGFPAKLHFCLRPSVLNWFTADSTIRFFNCVNLHNASL